MPGQSNFQLRAEVRASLALAGRAQADRIGAMPPDRQLALLCDTRPLHRHLFAPLLPDAMRDRAGVYRGTPGSAAVDVQRAVYVTRRAPGLKQRDLCTPAAEVGAGMDRLAQQIATIWGAAGGSRPGPDAAFLQLAQISHGFLSIHPYVDGNGHVFRIIAPVLAARLGLSARADWTIHPRPYDHVMSLCLQWYPHHPMLLACYLRRWFLPMA